MQITHEAHGCLIEVKGNTPDMHAVFFDEVKILLFDKLVVWKAATCPQHSELAYHQ